MSKRRKLLILGLTVFALLTFSVTGIMSTVLTSWFNPPLSRDIVLEDGRAAGVVDEDVRFGHWLLRLQSVLQGSFARGFNQAIAIPAHLLAYSPADDRNSDSRELAYAMLRRAAIENGIEVSDDELDATIDYTLSSSPQGGWTLEALAAGMGFKGMSGLTELRLTFREALRITKFVRLLMLGTVDVSDAELAEFVKEERKLVTADYVSWSVPELRAELEKKPVSDQALSKWLMELPDSKRSDAALFDPIRVRADFVGMLYEEADPADFEAELEDTVIGDAEAQQRYERDKDMLYRKPLPKKPEPKQDGEKPGAKKKGDAGKKPEQKKAEPKKAEPKKPEPKQPEPKQPEPKQPEPKQPEPKKDSNGGLQQAPLVQEPKPQTVILGGKPTDEAKSEVQGAKIEYRPFEEVKEEILRKLKLEAALKSILASARVARQKHEDEQQKKEKAEERLPFDFAAWWKTMAKGRPGLVFVPAAKTAQPPSDFAVLAPFGSFAVNYRLGETTRSDPLPSDIAGAEKGALFFYVQERVENAVKPLDSIRKEAREFYYETLASEKAEEAVKSFLKLVRSKAEELKKDEVAAHKKSVEERVSGQFDRWLADLQAKLKSFDTKLADPNRPKRALAKMQERKAELIALIAKKDERRSEIKKKIEEESKDELSKKLEPAMAEAFDLAVAAQKLSTKRLGPFYIDESRGSRFSLVSKGTELFLKTHATLTQDPKEGHVSEELFDAGERVRYVVRLSKVEKGGEDALSRRHLEEKRWVFKMRRYQNALMWGWDFQSLKDRYQWKEAKQ